MVVIFIIDGLIVGAAEAKSMGGSISKSFIKSGILLGLGIALHNFPEGLAIGSGFAASDSIGLSLAIVIGLHDMPEGIAMAVPLRIGGYNRVKILGYTILADTYRYWCLYRSPVGKYIPCIYIFVFRFAGGAMLYITCGELIPKTQTLYKGRATMVGMLVGITYGALYN